MTAFQLVIGLKIVFYQKLPLEKQNYLFHLYIINYFINENTTINTNE